METNLPELPFQKAFYGLGAWTDLPNAMSTIIRWAPPRQSHPWMRPQTLLEHVFSFGMVVDRLVHRLLSGDPALSLKIDVAMLQRCVQHHDIPEALLNRDVYGPRKILKDEVEEYLAYEQWAHLHHPEGMADTLIEAFLLQHLTRPEKDLAEFPISAQAHFKSLLRNHDLDGRIFHLAEQIDYFMYAIEQAEKATDQPDRIGLVVCIARGQLHALEKHTVGPDPLRNVVLEEVKLCKELVNKYGNLYRDQRATDWGVQLELDSLATQESVAA